MNKTKKNQLDLELRRLRETYEIFIILNPWKTQDHVYEYRIKVFKHVGIAPLFNKDLRGLDIIEECPIKDCYLNDYYEVLEYAINQVKANLRIL